jgi:hypothetical protein
MTEIFIVLIINTRYVRWESLPLESSFKDLKDLLKTKYNINECIAEIDKLIISKFKLSKLIHLCRETTNLTIKILTKDENFFLSKDIF